MSLATTGGGLGGGAGAGAMAPMPMANQMAQHTQNQAPPNQGHATLGSAPPPSAAALGADLLDKQQSLTMKQVRNVSHMPIVAVDLHGTKQVVAMFPPLRKSEDSPELPPTLVGKLDPLNLKPTVVASKVLRKWLTKGNGYTALHSDALSVGSSTDEVVTVTRPELWLGARTLKDVPSYALELYKSIDDGTSPAIAEETSPETTGVTIANSTLDGSTPSGDEYDRVVFRIKLHQSKKAITVLPEEAIRLMLCQAQCGVSRKVPKTANNNNDDDDDDDAEEDFLGYPMAIALPAWQCNDAAMEALLDATSGTGVFFQRGVAACAGSLLPGPSGSEVTPLLKRLNQVREKKGKEHEKENKDTPFDYGALLLLIGLTHDGIECTAVQVSALQGLDVPSCLYGNFKVLSEVSYPHEKPISILQKCVEEIKTNLEVIAPEADGPVAFVTYGTLAEQSEIKSTLQPSALETWEKVPIFPTHAGCVGMGTAVLGGVSHGRLKTMSVGSDNKKKPQHGIRVQNVAPAAVGIRMNYHNKDPNKWTPVKILFDFDRRVPAGPHRVEFNAAECAAHRNSASGKPISDADILDEAKKYEGSKGIPKREEAALNFDVEIVQKYVRTGEWITVARKKPLTVRNDEDDDEKVNACEEVALELSLGSTGMITSVFIGDGQSVVQALKSARQSKLYYYLGIVFAILFFGGILARSVWVEYVFDRDTKRLLAYYKHAVPGSMADGDEHNAHYLVWKYQYKKKKLWRSLEKKYGVPVRHAHEWDDEEDDADADKKEEEENNIDLDEESPADDEQPKDGEPDSSEEKKEEPDL